MTGIDTNVLVRYLTQDGTEAASATDFIEANLSEENPGVVCLVVLCELVWVLARAYRYTRTDICSILETLLTAREIRVERAHIAFGALQQYRNGPADFSDYVIGRLHVEMGAGETVTFDRNASRSPQFTLLLEKK